MKKVYSPTANCGGSDCGGKQKHATYDGPLAGVPSPGLYYWGYDFQTDGLTGPTATIGRAMYVNRTTDTLSVTLTFDVPLGNCGDHCLPGIEFKVGRWRTVFPQKFIANGKASATLFVAPGDTYGWVIGLWQATNPWLTIDASSDAHWSLAAIGMSEHPELADLTRGWSGVCQCYDGTTAACYAGTYASNGRMGPWGNDGYEVADAFNDCPAREGGGG